MAQGFSLGFRVYMGLGFSLGFRVYRLGFGVYGSGFSRVNLPIVSIVVPFSGLTKYIIRIL